MAVSTRLRGNAGVFFTIKKGAGSAVVYDDLKSYALTSEDKDSSDLTFSEAASGIGKDYTFTFTALSSFDAASIWQFLWANPGATDLLVTVGPAGNSTPTALKPHFTFTAKNPAKPEISVEAKTTTEGADFEHELEASTDVTMVIA